MDIHPLVAFLPDAERKERIPASKRRTVKLAVLVSPDEKARLTRMARERRCTIATLLRSSIDSVPAPRFDLVAVRAMHAIGQQLRMVLREAPNGDPGRARIVDLVLKTQSLYVELLRAIDR